MKRILLFILALLASLLFLVGCVFVGVNLSAKRIVNQQIAEALAPVDSTLTVRVGGVRVHPLRKNIVIKRIKMNWDKEALGASVGSLTVGLDQPIRMKDITFGYTIEPLELAPRLGNRPCTWVSLSLDSLRVSPMDWQTLLKSEKPEILIDSVFVYAQEVNVLRDLRFKSDTVYPTPQDALLAIPVPLVIHGIRAVIPTVNVKIATTNINEGGIVLRHIRANIGNVTNRRNAQMRVIAQGHLGDKAPLSMRLTFKNDTARTFITKMKVDAVPMSLFNTFSYPLVGISVDGKVDSIRADYTGNTSVVKGSFMMAYHDLSAKVDKQADIPYTIISKNAGAINFAVDAFIPKANPKTVSNKPIAYQVEWTYNPHQLYPVNLLGPVFDGIKKTLLPGLYIHKRVKK